MRWWEARTDNGSAAGNSGSKRLDLVAHHRELTLGLIEHTDRIRQIAAYG